MATPSRAKLFYGYAVCLVAVITFLVSAVGLANAAVNLSNPLQAERRFGNPVASTFEAYMATYRPPGPGADTTSVETLRRRWEALTDDRVARVRFESTRSLASSGLAILLSGLLFAFHWRWLRREEQADDARAAA